MSNSTVMTHIRLHVQWNKLRNGVSWAFLKEGQDYEFIYVDEAHAGIRFKLFDIELEMYWVTAFFVRELLSQLPDDYFENQDKDILKEQYNTLLKESSDGLALLVDPEGKLDEFILRKIALRFVEWFGGEMQSEKSTNGSITFKTPSVEKNTERERIFDRLSEDVLAMA